MGIIVFLWVMFAVALGFLGANKKIGYWGAFFISLIFSPILCLFVVLVSSPKESPVFIQQPKPTTGQMIDTADQLAKFKKLLDDGAISKEEYEVQKNRILNL